VKAALVTEITLENILNAIEKVKEKEQPKLPNGAKKPSGYKPKNLKIKAAHFL